MLIFERERLDGLANELEKSSSIAFEVIPAARANLDNISLPLRQEDIKKIDLFYFESVLASVGWNKNDDVFDSVELWLARESAVNKKINYMHDETDIIGHMTTSNVFDFQSKIVASATPVEEIPTKFDVVVGGFLYKYWEDGTLKDRISRIIASIEKREAFVSMECIFPNFDYAVITPDGAHKVIARTKDTAFLTKHLRRYGGKGVYDGHQVGRLMRNMIFTGNGIVDRPANPRSLILKSEISDFVGSTASINILQSEHIMPDITKEMYDAMVKRAEVAEAKAGEVVTKEVEVLKSTVASLRDTNDKTVADLAKAKEDLKKVSDELLASKEVVKARDEQIVKLEGSIKTVETQLNDAKAALDKHAKDAKLNTRKTAVADLDVTEAKAEEFLKTFAEVSDEIFNVFVANMPKKNKTEPVTTATETVTDLLNNAIRTEASVVIPSDTQKNLTAKASEWFASTFITNNKE